MRTWLSSEDTMIALARGYELAFGRAPGDAVLAGVYGLVALENDSGEALYGFNFGNLGAPDSDSPWTRDPSGSRMRAFETAEDGATTLWRTLFSDYRTALRAFEGADLDRAIAELERIGYFEADGRRYRESVPALARRAERTILPTLRHRAGLAGKRLSELAIAPRYERTVRVVAGPLAPEERR